MLIDYTGSDFLERAVMTSSPTAKPKTAALPQEPLPPVCDFLDLKAQFATIREEVMDAVTRVMESQLFILGKEVAAFEEEVAQSLGAKHAVGCTSGTDALILAL